MSQVGSRCESCGVCWARRRWRTRSERGRGGGSTKKVHLACTLARRGQYAVSTVFQALQVARSNIVVQLGRSRTRVDGRRRRVLDDAALLADLHTVIADRPTNGYRCVAARGNRQRRQSGRSPANHKTVYRLMRDHQLLLVRHLTGPTTAALPSRPATVVGARTASRSRATTASGYGRLCSGLLRS